MADSIEKIDRIINKIGLILERNLKLEEEVKNLKQNLSELENNRKHLEADKDKIEKEVRRLKLAKSVDVSNEDRTVIRKELKNYMKEIDKCMALLNK